MIDDLVKPTNDPSRWKACADEINDVLLKIDMDAARRKSSGILSEKDAEAERAKAMEEAKKALQSVQYAQWPFNRTHYTLGQLDTERLVLCCERKLLDWPTVFSAKAAFGTPSDLQHIFDQARLNGANLDFINPLRYAAKPMLLVAGLRHEGNIETTVQLLKMGADPGLDNAQVFQTAVLEGRPDIGRALARHDKSRLIDLQSWVTWAKNNRKTKAYEDFRDIWWDYGRFSVPDRETLIETKTLPDNTGNLRIIYNFAARRVEEIHEFTNPRQNVVSGFTFDEYGEAALDSARAKLIELGGSPSDSGSPLRGKTAVARPASFGLGKG